LICKYAPTSTIATDIIAMHSSVIGTSANNYIERLKYDYNFDTKSTFTSLAI